MQRIPKKKDTNFDKWVKPHRLYLYVHIVLSAYRSTFAQTQITDHSFLLTLPLPFIVLP